MRKFLVLAPLAGCIIWFLLMFLHTYTVIAFLELHFSPDKHIERPADVLKLVSLSLVSLSMAFSTFILNISRYSNDFLRSPLLLGKLEILLIFSLSLTHAVSFPYPELQKLYVEDALLESMTAVLAIAAGFILIYVQTLFDQKNIQYQILLFSTAFLFFGCEEISWGQRIFGINSPELFQQHNYQNETTLHNFFNPILNEAMTLLNIVFAMYFLLSANTAQWFSSQIRPLVQNPNRYLLGLIFCVLALQCYLFGGELSEEIVSVLMLFSSLRLFNSTKTKPTP